jgi:hypothetical protein
MQVWPVVCVYVAIVLLLILYLVSSFVVSLSESLAPREPRPAQSDHMLAWQHETL